MYVDVDVLWMRVVDVEVLRMCCGCFVDVDVLWMCIVDVDVLWMCVVDVYRYRLGIGSSG